MTLDGRPSQVDASGQAVDVPRAPARLVSLVPSVTETLFALGLGDRVVGTTDWCIHPADGVAGTRRVRGTKNPDVEAIAELAPDLVIANLEENREIDVRRLRERGIAVWVDFPRTVDDAIAQVRWLAALGADGSVAAGVIGAIEDAVRAARAARPRRPLLGFVAVWKDPWMTLARDTYAHDLLALAGIANLYADSSDRYPRVTLADVAAHAPEVVLLPDEPYRFTNADARELAGGALADTPAARTGRIAVIDGTLPFWHGPRLVAALAELQRLTADRA